MDIAVEKIKGDIASLGKLDRANDIISTFLSLAKNKRVEMKLGNLNDVITELYPLLEADTFRRGMS